MTATERALWDEAARRRRHLEQQAVILCARCGAGVDTLDGLARHLDEARTGPLAQYHQEEDA